MSTTIKMRDRRNTNLSVSLTIPSPPGALTSNRSSLNEKWHPASPLPSPMSLSPAAKVYNLRRSLGSSWITLIIRSVAAAAALLFVWHHIYGGVAPLSSILGLASNDDEALNGVLITNTTLPDVPSTVIVSDKHGRPSRWTVSIPPTRSFPLTTSDYEVLCHQCASVKGSMAHGSRSFRAKGRHQRASFFSPDSTYLDMEKAESIGVLPKAASSRTGNTCDRSLTFVFGENDASFGETLILLWMSYGLAKKEGRAFFIDDSHWPYGTYGLYFAPIPSQGCSPPPPQHMVPCPHAAKHLVVSAATAPFTFDTSFDHTFLRPFRRGVERSRWIYDLLRAGYDDLFHLVGDDSVYAADRVAESRQAAEQIHGKVIGIHIRRGDGHPSEYQFSHDYLPLERYAEAAHQLRESTRSKSHMNRNHPHETPVSTVYLASDDPAIFSYPELWHAIAPIPLHPAQERIQLATKAALDRALPLSPQDPSGAYTKHVDENAGWEGGFYKALFLTLGKPRQRFSREGQDLPLSAQGIRLRQLIGRAYLLDLAVLSQADGVVCAVSSATCRVLGVMMGWDSIQSGAWLNVDDGRSWSWDGRK